MESDIFKFLDLSGVGNSGKSAVVDLLKEIDPIHVSETWFEFDLLRIQGGVLDLRHALVESWSPIRSNEAIKIFKQRIYSMGVNPKLYDMFGIIKSSSQRYDARFNNKFLNLANAFAESFVLESYMAIWPYDNVSKNNWLRFVEKLLYRVGCSGIQKTTIHLVDGDHFDSKVNVFMKALYTTVVDNKKRWVTLNNGFEPYNPSSFFKMLPGSKQIVILRDPRDVYVSGKSSKKISRQDSSLLSSYQKKSSFSFLASDDIEVFVKRFRLYHKNVMQQPHPQVLKINFEDLCLNYEPTISTIFSFLGITQEEHTAKKQYFNPDSSTKNVGLWKRYSEQDEIRYIESMLPDLLYPS